ncbi:MAG: hypothetical protein M1838_004756 [Thelocarpon superellum]|nr:MAG: hypothetical protein M1838_004756 [Thelocarpon superellum]
MANRTSDGRHTLADSTMTLPSDSESYSAHREASPSPPSSSAPPMILYSPPTLWGLLRGAAINVLLPFINGLMLGFGELFAHEAAFRLGWGGTKVFPQHRNARAVGPGIAVRDDPMERRRREDRELEHLTSLE